MPLLVVALLFPTHARAVVVPTAPMEAVPGTPAGMFGPADAESARMMDAFGAWLETPDAVRAIEMLPELAPLKGFSSQRPGGARAISPLAARIPAELRPRIAQIAQLEKGSQFQMIAVVARAKNEAARVVRSAVEHVADAARRGELRPDQAAALAPDIGALSIYGEWVRPSFEAVVAVMSAPKGRTVLMPAPDAMTVDPKALAEAERRYASNDGKPTQETLRQLEFQWHLSYAKRGVLQAQYEVGKRFMQSADPAHPAHGFQWLAQAAAGGHSDAQFAVGHSYEHGVGVAKDPVLSYRWYANASKAGNWFASDKSREMLRVAALEGGVPGVEGHRRALRHIGSMGGATLLDLAASVEKRLTDHTRTWIHTGRAPAWPKAATPEALEDAADAFARSKKRLALAALVPGTVLAGAALYAVYDPMSGAIAAAATLLAAVILVGWNAGRVRSARRDIEALASEL